MLCRDRQIKPLTVFLRQETKDVRAHFAQGETTPSTSSNFCYTFSIAKGNRVQKGWKAQAHAIHARTDH